MALPSWHPKAKVSTFVPNIGSNITSFQHSYVVTEQGVATCFGKSQNEQAFNLIENAAHPNAKEALRESARGLNLLK
jgi:acyl-CoA hydrolase